MGTIRKSGGTTPTERHLAALCEGTFLGLWSYPNLYRDDGKELCDLLVVFGRDIIIFSDKSCAFPDTGDVVLDWSRWFKRSIASSAKQVYGAERWIRSRPQGIFLDRGCTTGLPLGLPAMEDCRISRVVVARGAGDRCSAFFGGDSGSLMVRSDVVGAAHVNPAAGRLGVFRIGQINPSKGFVHVLDDFNLEILMSELDTVADFVNYLQKKEALFASGKVVYANGEEEILSYYMTHLEDDGEHGFDFPTELDLISLSECYAGLRSDEQYKAKKAADRVSYLWDHLIDYFGRHIAEGTLETGNNLGITETEVALRIMAAENRFARRHLGHALLDAMQRQQPFARVCATPEDIERGYCFLIYPCPIEQDYSEYRQVRAGMLASYCRVMKLKFPRLENVIGIGTEPAGGRGRSEDLIYLDGLGWTNEDNENARRIQEELGILGSPTTRKLHYDEWPIVPPESGTSDLGATPKSS